MGKSIMVHCKVCSEIKGRENIFVPEFDFWKKHTCKQKCKVALLHFVVGQYFMSIKN